MSPKTTPSAAKLKPAAPIAEAGLRFSAEILVTRIFYGSQYPAQRLSLTLVRKFDQRTRYRLPTSPGD
jgi:hypothetical protein